MCEKMDEVTYDGIIISSVSLTFRIVESLVKSKFAGITDSAEKIDLGKNTMHNHLKPLGI